MMPETRFTAFPAISVDPMVGLWLHRSAIFILFPLIFTITVVWRPNPNVIRSFSVWRASDVCK